MKQNHLSNIALYEEQNRKLKDILGERDREISDLQNKLALFQNEYDLEVQQLHNQINELNERKKNLELDFNRRIIE